MQCMCVVYFILFLHATLNLSSSRPQVKWYFISSLAVNQHNNVMEMFRLSKVLHKYYYANCVPSYAKEARRAEWKEIQTTI